MRKRRRLKSYSVLSEINVVPYIDVMLVLLVILMVTAPLLTQGVPINLPQAQAKLLQTENQPPLVVSIDATGHYTLNSPVQSQPSITIVQLKHALLQQLAAAQAQHKAVSVWVKADKATYYGNVVTLIDLLQQLGIQQVGLVTFADGHQPVNKLLVS